MANKHLDGIPSDIQKILRDDFKASDWATTEEGFLGLVPDFIRADLKKELEEADKAKTTGVHRGPVAGNVKFDVDQFVNSALGVQP